MPFDEKYEYKRPLSLQELQALPEEDSDLENSDEIDAVYIPPTVDTVTDEEDINDDLIMEQQGPVDVAGTFEVQTKSSDDRSSFAGPSTSGTQNKPSGKKQNKQKLHVPSWTKEEARYSSVSSDTEFAKIKAIKGNFCRKTPLEIFFLFFDGAVCNSIVEFSLKYSKDNN